MQAHALRELPPTLSVEKAGRILGIGRTSAYSAAAAGEIPTVRVGRRLVVPTPKLLDMLGIAKLEEGASGPDR